MHTPQDKDISISFGGEKVAVPNVIKRDDPPSLEVTGTFELTEDGQRFFDELIVQSTGDVLDSQFLD